MDRQTALPSIQKKVRKAATASLLAHSHSHGQDYRGENGTPDERTSLIGQNGNRDTKGHNPTWEFFLNSKHTPGCDSPKPWVKYPAYVWHTAKATLLSST